MRTLSTVPSEETDHARRSTPTSNCVAIVGVDVVASYDVIVPRTISYSIVIYELELIAEI